ncbi:hypothetical protein DL546_004487 [Coniochaeta pulveracea]|uniref:Allergen n=1 Tax=Coniochaeta pulveracea TaxID=177199 RepID=A0A420YF42_9PEZI|nr:hypothetical protein DL546_004487 [Coniochaeta pulveracea]
MDKARQAIHNIERMAGKHDTTVHEHVGPAVTKETVKPERVEEQKTVVDKEVHQDHYHRTVQPVFDKEVLPEKHEHRVAGTETREFDHRHNDNTRERFEAERGQLRDERHVAETKVAQVKAAGVEGEHVHHHVHEEIQPVLHKEVIQPEVVHTTVPIHEVHHEAAKHHGTTTLPPVSIDEFKAQGGTLSGRQERRDHFDGCAKGLHSEGGEPIDGHIHSSTTSRTTETTGTGHHHTGTGAAAAAATGAAAGTTGTRSAGTDSRLPGSGHSHTGGTGTTGTTGTHGHGLEQTESHKKPSLLDRLNPMKDTDNDGKKGIMD